MIDLLLIAIKYSLVSNVVLSQFLGICPFLGVSKKTESSKGMGGAVIFVIVIASVITMESMLPSWRLPAPFARPWA